MIDTVFYRSRPCYESLNWPFDNFNLKDYMVSIGPFASIYALYPKSAVVNLQLTDVNDCITVLNGSGMEIFRINWNFTLNQIVKVGFTRDSKLIMVLKTGICRLYYNYQGDFNEYDLKLGTIKDARFSLNGDFAVQTHSNKFAYIPNIQDPSPVIFQQLETEDVEPYHITTWTFTASKGPSETAATHGEFQDSVRFFIFTTTGISILTSTSTEPILLNHAFLQSVHLVSISPNQNFAALYAANSIYILDGEFNDLLIQHENVSNVSDLRWCSNDVVVYTCNNSLNVLGPTLETLKFYTSGTPYLHAEIDGLYYLTNDGLNFFSRVSNITEETFKIGSSSPSSVLLDSIEYLDRRSPKANDLLEVIMDDLVLAVDGCIRAASEEFDVYWQKNLLRAAAFGKVNLDLYDSTEFVQTCNYLRILNIIRAPDKGIFMTYNQLQEFGIEKLIDVLLLRQLHYLCLKICDFLDLPNFKIMTDWASCKLKYSTNSSDDELLSLIVTKLEKEKIDWTSLSYVAHNEGRTTLAKNFLTYEPSTSKKVRFLLDVGDGNYDELEYALTISDEDSDADSILLILLQLHGTLTNVEFFKIINDKPSAIGVLKSYFYQFDDTMLENFMFQDDDIIGQILLENNMAKKTVLMNRSKYTQFLQSPTNNFNKVEQVQLDLRNTFANIVAGEPIIKTLEKIIVVDLKKAQNVASKLNVTSRQFAMCVLQTLAPIAAKHPELYDFANSKHGKVLKFETYFRELLKRGEKRQAGLYLKSCKDMASREKIKAYIQCGMWKEAVQEAAYRKDTDILTQMRDSRTGWESKLASEELQRLA